MGSTGSRAAAEVHDRVREDLLVDDIADEGATLRRDVLRPLVAARFGPQAPVPVFRRALAQAIDTEALTNTLAVAVRELGMEVPRRWLHQALGVPEPQAGEAVVAREVTP
jgi:phage gp29-like protein